MTLKELKERIDAILESGNHADDIVCIPNNKVGIGRTACTKVESVQTGFDWDDGNVFIYPENKMVERP